MGILISGTRRSVSQGTINGIIHWESLKVGNGFGVHFDNRGGPTLHRIAGLDGAFLNAGGFSRFGETPDGVTDLGQITDSGRVGRLCWR